MVAAKTTPAAPAPVSLSVPDTYQQFFTDVLGELGIQATQANLDALASVAHYEGLNSYDNPLNAVIKEPGSTDFNSVGVQQYTSFSEGVQGTVDLLKGTRWGAVVSSLKSGSESQIIGQFDSVYQTWGSSGPSVSSAAPNVLTAKVDSGTSSPFGNASGKTDPTSVGGVLNTIENSAGSAADAITSPLAFLQTIGADLADIGRDVTSADFWIRIGFIVLGLFILLIAIDKLSDGGISGSSGGSTPGTTDVIVDNVGSAAQSTGRAAQSAGQKATRINRRYGRSGNTSHTPVSASPATTPSGGKHRAENASTGRHAAETAAVAE